MPTHPPVPNPPQPGMTGDPTAPFRTILPAPDRAGKQRNEDNADDTGFGLSPVSSQRRLLKRIRSVAQACHMCRQMKAKCDGGRPRCGNCIDRDRQCGYEGEVGQSRQAAMRARLAAFETVFASLRTASPAESERLIQRLRTTDDPISVLREDDIASPVLASTSRHTHTATPSSNAPQISPGLSPRVSPGPSTGITETGSSPRQSVDLLLNSNDHSHEHENETDIGYGSRATYPVAPVAIELVFPNYAATTKALAEFYENRSGLFQVFPEKDVQKFFDIFFGTPSSPVSPQDKKIAMSCLAGVVAVGMRYAPGIFDRFTRNAVYDIAKYHFELVLETSPLLAAKLAALLALFNIMNRNTMAHIWIGIGLRLCRSCGLSNKTPSDPNMSPAEWFQHRKTWRTLVFLSCWLSFAMCSITGEEVDFDKTSLVAIELETNPDIRELIQTESTKISILTVEILRVHLTFKRITVLSFESVTRDLESWYSKLPTDIHLASIQNNSLPPDVLRSVYHLHLLYLGALLLIYRRMASQYDHVFQKQISHLSEGPEAIPVGLLKQGVEAARTSAMICSVLHQDEAMSKRCWIVILQAYASSIVLLHVVAQKQAHGCHWETWQEDLRRAEVCLQLLKNGMADDAVKELYGGISPIFQQLSKATQTPFEARDGRSGSRHGHENHETVSLLLTLPMGAPPERTQIPLELMSMLGHPFRIIGAKAGKADEGRSAIDASSVELPQISGLRW